MTHAMSRSDPHRPPAPLAEAPAVGVTFEGVSKSFGRLEVLNRETPFQVGDGEGGDRFRRLGRYEILHIARDRRFFGRNRAGKPQKRDKNHGKKRDRKGAIPYTLAGQLEEKIEFHHGSVIPHPRRPVQ